MILPYDVFTIVIDLLGHEDSVGGHNALAACARTCHDLLPLCQANLFRRIQLWNRDTKRYGLAFTRSHKLIIVLADCPHLAVLVTNLELNIDSPQFGRGGPNALLKALRNLTAVKSFCLDLFRNFWPTEAEEIGKTILHILRLPSLVDLKLLRINDLRVMDLLCCQHLQRLSLHNVRFHSYPSMPGKVSPSSIVLPELNLLRVDIDDLLTPDQRQLAVIDPTSLKRVSIARVELLSGWHCLRLLFQQAGPYIRELHLSSLFTDPLGCVSGLTDILEKYQGRLRTLGLALISDDVLRVRPGYQQTWSEIEKLSNSSVARKTIETIHISFTCEGVDSAIPSENEWQQLQVSLTKPNVWPVLRLVTVTVNYNYPVFPGIDDARDSELRGIVCYFSELSTSENVKFIFRYSVESED